ncbi:hypothetical protein KRP22_004654 [Phytophthora ramorum]|nr:hypothetical protein KRP22_10285 [Phytophthora ramorum]
MAPTSRGASVIADVKAESPESMERSDSDEQRAPNDQMTTPMSSPMVSDDSEAKLEDNDYGQLTPRSRRRRKNRDQMRLARQKERETMQRLRETMHRLEARYQEAMARGILEPATGSSPHAPAADSVMDSSSSAQVATAAEVVSPCQYAELVEEGARLKDENFHFRQALHEKNKLQETLERLHDDLHQPPTQEETNMRRCVFEDQCAHDAWTPLTNEEVWGYIHVTRDRVAGSLQSISRRAAARKMDPTTRPLPPFLGWQVRYHREDHEMLFTFEKPFYHVTALQAMQQTWNNELTMQSYRKPVDVATQSMTVFQLINDDTYVFRRRMRLREQVATTHYLRFRLKTNSGYAIGHCSINRNPSPQGDDIWAGNLSLWTDFNTTWSELDQEHCVVRISGRMNVNATESAATRAAVDIIFGLLRWENLNIGPVFTFTAS